MDTAPRLEDLYFDRADRMRRALRISGLSVGSMADYLGVHRNSVTAWINGHTDPDVRTLRLFALRTGVPYDWLRHGIIPSGPDAGNAMYATNNPYVPGSSPGGPTHRPHMQGPVEQPAGPLTVGDRRLGRFVRLAA